jgi:hypothetical protein
MKKLIYVLGAKIWHYKILISLILFVIILFIDFKAPVITLLNQSEIETIEGRDEFVVRIDVVDSPCFFCFFDDNYVYVWLKQISGNHKAKPYRKMTPYMLSKEGDSLLDYYQKFTYEKATFRLKGIAPIEATKMSFSVSVQDRAGNISSIIIPVKVTQAPPLRVCKNGSGTIVNPVCFGCGVWDRVGYCCKEDLGRVLVINNGPPYHMRYNESDYCELEKIEANYDGVVPSLKRMERPW